MLNEDKIKVMTAMAVYEEKYGKQDRIADSYYMGDYIFKKNSWTRILIFIGFVILAFFYLGYNILNENIDFFSEDFSGIIFKVVIVLIILLIIYTSIGTAINKKKYNDAQNRLEKLAYLQKIFNQMELEELVGEFTEWPENSVAASSRRWLRGELDSDTLKKILERSHSDRKDWNYETDEMYKKAIRLLSIEDLYGE